MDSMFYLALGVGVGGWGRCTHVKHGRSRMTIDPRTPPMPGRSTSGFRRPGRRCLHQALRSTLRCWASRMKGELHPLLTNDFEAKFLALDDSVE